MTLFDEFEFSRHPLSKINFKNSRFLTKIENFDRNYLMMRCTFSVVPTDVYRRRLMYTRGVDTKIGSFWPKNSTHPFSFLISSPIFFLSFLVKGTNWKYRVRDWTSISCECRNFLCQLRAYTWVVYDRRQWDSYFLAVVYSKVCNKV